MSFQGDKLKEIANAIREKKGTTDLIVANDFASEILSISGGAGGDYNINSVYMPDGTQELYITSVVPEKEFMNITIETRRPEISKEGISVDIVGTTGTYTVVTDVNGKASIELSKGTYTVTAISDGSFKVSDPVIVTIRDVPLEVVFSVGPNTQTLLDVTIDTYDGLNKAGIKVYVRDDNNRIIYYTDDNGKLSAIIMAGRLEIGLEETPRGYETPEYISKFNPGDPTFSASFMLEEKTTATINLTLTSFDGQNTAGRSIDVWNSTNDRGWSLLTNSQSKASADLPIGDTYTIKTTPDESVYKPVNQKFNATESGYYDITLYQGEPSQNLIIYPKATDKPEGTYVVTDIIIRNNYDDTEETYLSKANEPLNISLPISSYTVSAKALDEYFSPSPVDVWLPKNTDVDVNFLFIKKGEEFGIIKVILTSYDGGGIANRVISAESGGSVSFYATDATGIVEIPRMDSNSVGLAIYDYIEGYQNYDWIETNAIEGETVDVQFYLSEG